MILQDWKRLVVAAFFLIFLASIVFFSVYRGLILLSAFLFFGVLSNIGKEHEVKLLSLACLVVLSLVNIVLHGVNFGIEFSGGIRIPIILKKPVDAETMNQIVNVLKKRASLMGLTQVKVTAVGPTEVDVELANVSDPRLVEEVKRVITKQGSFIGVVDGKIAISGEHILPGTVMKLFPPYTRPGYDWTVVFSVDRAGAEHFAKVVKGKAHHPIYMFLDRPMHADIFLTKKELTGGSSAVSVDQALEAVRKAMELEGDDSRVLLLDNLNISTLNGTGRIAIISNASAVKWGTLLKARGYELKVVKNITPQFVASPVFHVDHWAAVGLLSAPQLGESVTTGVPSFQYEIGGAVHARGPDRYTQARAEARVMETLLRSGSLPVEINVGSAIRIPSPLGREFLKLSLMGVAITVLAIAVFVAIRYRHPLFVIPILAISLSELAILMGILGSFTVDLAAMAGIIAALGVGVDAQIVITDELLKHKNANEGLQKAFEIITINVIVAITSMIPLLFSGIVEVINFALSTILGALLGLLISRPAYAALVEYLLQEGF